MYVQRNNMACPRNVYIRTAILTALCHFTGMEHFHGTFMSAATIKSSSVFM